VWLLDELFHENISLLFYQDMIYLGCIFYVIGILFILYQYFILYKHKMRSSIHRHTRKFQSFIYSALSITGIAMIVSQSFSDEVVRGLWLLQLVLAFLIELLTLCHFVREIITKGLRQTLFTYDSSFWPHLFSLCAFYAFALSYYIYEYSTNRFISLVVKEGKYILLALVIWHLLLAILFISKSGFHDVSNAKNIDF
jgi:hypothetical protein